MIPPKNLSRREEIMWRLAFDLAWVCEHLVKITEKKSNRLIKFRFNDAQRWVQWNIMQQEAANKPVRLWILKGRQFGITTFFVVRNLIKSAFHGQNSLILAHKETPGKSMVDKAERALNNMPTLKDGADVIPLARKPSNVKARQEMSWNEKDFNALLKMESAENEDAGVSETYQHIHLTEVPLWKNAHHTMGGLLPTLAEKPGTTMVGEFTARGEGDYTHDVWVNAENGDSPFQAIFLPWYWHVDYTRPRRPDDRRFNAAELQYKETVGKAGHAYPLKKNELELLPRFQKIYDDTKQILPRDLAEGFRLSDDQLLWRRDKIAEFRGDVDMFRREYPATPNEAWQASGRRLIPPNVMDQMDVSDKMDLYDRGEYDAVRAAKGRAKRVYRRRSDGRLWRWEPPLADTTYILDADTSSGVGADYSAAHVLKVTYREIMVVASFRGKERPHDFARTLARMGQHYRTGASVVHGTSKVSGGTPSLLVVERNHHGEHVIYELVETLKYRRLYKHDERGRSDNWKYKSRYGFPVTRSNKMPMLLNLVQVCHDRELIVPCDRTRSEMRGLMYLDDLDEKAGAPPGSHDDLAMAIGEGVLVATQKAAFRRRPDSTLGLDIA